MPSFEQRVRSTSVEQFFLPLRGLINNCLNLWNHGFRKKRPMLNEGQHEQRRFHQRPVRTTSRMRHQRRKSAMMLVTNSTTRRIPTDRRASNSPFFISASFSAASSSVTYATWVPKRIAKCQANASSGHKLRSNADTRHHRRIPRLEGYWLVCDCIVSYLHDHRRL
jgi:hypothetical protein